LTTNVYNSSGQVTSQTDSAGLTYKLCLPVLIGVCADGRKELVAIAGGYRDPAKSWADRWLTRGGRPP
jgi:hypothetical protein